MSVSGYARFAHLNELPGEGETEDEISDPLPYDSTTAGVKVDNRFNRLWTSVAFDVIDN